MSKSTKSWAYTGAIIELLIGIPMSFTSANIFKNTNDIFSRGVQDFLTLSGYFMVFGGLAGLLGAFLLGKYLRVGIRFLSLSVNLKIVPGYFCVTGFLSARWVLLILLVPAVIEFIAACQATRAYNLSKKVRDNEALSQ